jgi:hypothetical protein
MKPIVRLDLFNPVIATVTATGPVTPSAGLDVSGVIGDWRICCLVISQTAGKHFQINLEGSCDGFVNDRKTQLIASGAGSISAQADQCYSVRKHEMETWIIGIVNGQLRANVVKLDAGSTLAFRCWIEWASAL